MEVRLLQEAQAIERLRRPDFARAWDDLHAACPWSTAFQSRPFAETWFASYVQSMAPLLLFAAEGEKLQGLLLLARDRATSGIFNVGGHQAEYHCWLARAEAGDAFIVSALKALRQADPNAVLHFRYLPPDVPLGWLAANPRLAPLAEQRSEPRPLLELEDEASFAAKLRKKSNRSRLNRLRDACGGELTGAVVEDASELSLLMAEIAREYDHRQSEISHVRPFAEDPHKSEFYVELLRRGLLHAYVVRAGERFVAGILSIRNTESLAVGIFSHAADLAEFSPGKFAMLMLARDAAREGYRSVDLTPGGAWKARFASRFDSVTELTFHFCPKQAARLRRRRWAERAAKKVMASIGVTPDSLRRLAKAQGAR